MIFVFCFFFFFIIYFQDDFSRVKLEVNDNDPNSDYINASFIKVKLDKNL